MRFEYLTTVCSGGLSDEESGVWVFKETLPSQSLTDNPDTNIMLGSGAGSW